MLAEGIVLKDVQPGQLRRSFGGAIPSGGAAMLHEQALELSMLQTAAGGVGARGGAAGGGGAAGRSGLLLSVSGGGRELTCDMSQSQVRAVRRRPAPARGSRAAWRARASQRASVGTSALGAAA